MSDQSGKRDRIGEIAERLGDSLCDEGGCNWNSLTVERILREELKELLEAAQAVIDRRCAEHAPSWRDRLAKALEGFKNGAGRR